MKQFMRKHYAIIIGLLCGAYALYCGITNGIGGVFTACANIFVGGLGLLIVVVISLIIRAIYRHHHKTT
jgi:hypothetical protein